LLLKAALKDLCICKNIKRPQSGMRKAILGKAPEHSMVGAVLERPRVNFILNDAKPRILGLTGAEL
jgi:hypothetical protein